jgi:hypothetical protein
MAVCANVSAVYVGGLCNRTSLSMLRCVLADETNATATRINGTHVTAASCESDMTDVCLALQGSFNPQYCLVSPEETPFCGNLAVSTASSSNTCTSDADCYEMVMKLCGPSSPGDTTEQCNISKIAASMRPTVTVMCCEDVNTIATQACTGVNLSALELLVDTMRGENKCGVYPNCAISTAGGALSHATIALTPAISRVNVTSDAVLSVCSWKLVVVALLLLSFVFVKP